MSNTAALRASSMLVSAGLLGGMVVLALTFSITLPPAITFVDLNPITAEREPEPPPPPVVRTQPNPPPTTQTEDAEPTEAPFPLTTIINTDPVGPISFGDPSPEITNPHWLRRPRDLQQYYPRRALARGVEGLVVLDCMVAVTGTLRCSVVSETPQRWGFAEAALRIAGDHRMAPAMRDGVAVEGRYRMRVPFRAE